MEVIKYEDLKQFYDYYETQVYEDNEQVFGLIMQELVKIIPNLESKYAEDVTQYSDKVLIFKNHFVYKTDLCEFFFDLLRKHNYNFYHEIKDAIYYLCFLDDPNDNKEVIRDFLNSPVIQDISFSQGVFSIFSEQFGRTDVMLAAEYFRNDRAISKFLRTKELAQECNSNTKYLSRKLPTAYSITSLCPYFFMGDYYHSYTYDKDSGFIIDFTHNAVVARNDYYNIWRPRELSNVLNSELNDEIRFIDRNYLLRENYGGLLGIAIYKHYLQSIGYDGSLKDAPVIKL